MRQHENRSSRQRARGNSGGRVGVVGPTRATTAGRLGLRLPADAWTGAEILRVEESLWIFARVEGVPPTNNAAERAERHAVIWRRISGGTDSAAGSRFVERMLSVVATCRQEGRNVLDYLTSCFEAARSGQAVPSLLPAEPPKVKVA